MMVPIEPAVTVAAGARVTVCELIVEPPPGALRTGLESAGLAVGDTLAVLKRLAEGVTPQEIAARIAAGSLLHKRTEHGRRHLLAAVRRRYVAPQAPLQGTTALAAAICAVRSPIARSQILLPYLLLSDRAAFEVASGLVIPRMAEGNRLAKADVVGALDGILERDGRKAWSPALRTRWAEGLLSVLRDVGALGRGRRREQLLGYEARPEAFCFHLWGLYAAGIRGAALRDTSFWRLLLLSAGEARRLLAVMSARRWWRIRALGEVVEGVPAYGSLTEWLLHGLG